MLSLGLLIASLSGCETLPPVPHHVQYGVYPDVNPPGFYGVDNVSKAHVYHGFMDMEMKAAQCLTADDYKAWEAWIQSVEDIAQRRCK